MTFQPGEEFAAQHRLRIVRCIGKGGMGEVYEARLLGAEGFEKTVALKIIRSEHWQDPEFIRFFIGEAELVARLVHENIVQIYELGTLGALHYIAMEYVEGVQLREFAERHVELGRFLPTELCVFIVSRVCRALAYAHGRCDEKGCRMDIVHRDISPDNVMITWGGVVKLADFGISKAPEFGKPAYMSPERVLGETADRRADIFALGIVLHELLSNARLFTGASHADTLRAVLELPIPRIRAINPNVAEEVERVLSRALERDRALRYTDVGAMGHDLEHYMYHDRFGPTNEKLRDYLTDLFGTAPGAGTVRLDPAPRSTTLTAPAKIAAPKPKA